jgi:arginyl-tRNA synthetase
MENESKGVFKERNAFFKRMEDGDEKAIGFWKRVRDVNENYAKLYAGLNVSFDEWGVNVESGGSYNLFEETLWARKRADIEFQKKVKEFHNPGT